MDDKLAMEMFESGDAVGVFTTVILMRTETSCFISFDGKRWEETDSELIIGQIK